MFVIRDNCHFKIVNFIDCTLPFEVSVYTNALADKQTIATTVIANDALSRGEYDVVVVLVIVVVVVVAIVVVIAVIVVNSDYCCDFITVFSYIVWVFLAIEIGI